MLILFPDIALSLGGTLVERWGLGWIGFNDSRANVGIDGGHERITVNVDILSFGFFCQAVILELTHYDLDGD